MIVDRETTGQDLSIVTQSLIQALPQTTVHTARPAQGSTVKAAANIRNRAKWSKEGTFTLETLARNNRGAKSSISIGNGTKARITNAKRGTTKKALRSL